MTSAIRRARLELLAAAALFSTGGAAIKLAALSGFWIAGLRSGIAGLCLLAVLRGVPRPDRRQVLVSTTFATTMILFVLANQLTTAANTAFLQATAPLHILLLGPLLLREPIRGSDVPLLLLLGAGMSLLFLGSQDAQATAPDPWLGNVLALAAGVSWALTVLGLRWLASSPVKPGDGSRSSSMTAVALGNLVTAAVALPIAVALDPTLPAPADWAVVSWLGVFQIGGAYLFLGRGVQHVRALEASLLLFLEPVLSGVWAYLVHGEVMSPSGAAGGALVFVAILWRALSARA